MPKLFAVDSMAVLYRGYFAMIRNPLINSKGLNTSGVRTVLMQLLKILEEERPDYLAVASDSSEPTFRHKRFPEYKATREKMPDDLVAQLPYLPRLMAALGLPYLILPGYEADDIIGTLMRWCSEREIAGVMVSSDKDFMQLITDSIVMLNHHHERLGLEAVRARFGGTPAQVIEVLGLMGDASDNIPGVRGVGEKTAVKLIQEHGSIAAVYENLVQVKGKLREKLEVGHESALLSRELVTIDTEVPIPATLEDLHVERVVLCGNPEFLALLEELEFNTLLKRFGDLSVPKVQPKPSTLPETPEQAPPPSATGTRGGAPALAVSEIPETEPEPMQVAVNLLETPEQCERFLQSLPSGTPCGLAFAHDGGHQVDLRLTHLAISGESGRAGVLEFKAKNPTPPHPDNRQPTTEILQAWLSNPEVPKVVHNLKQVTQILASAGIELEGVVGDVMIAAHLADPLEQRQDLDFLISRRLQFRRPETVTEDGPQLSMFVDEVATIRQRLGEDAVFIWALHLRLTPQLEQSGTWPVYRALELPLAQTLARLEQVGVSVDVPKLNEISNEFEGRLNELRAQLHQLAGEEFNVNSIVELQHILYEKLRLHEQFRIKPKKIKLGLGLSTNEETLEKLAGHDLPRTLLNYRSLYKLKHTYLDQLPTYVHSRSGRIHSSFNQTATATGRLSSENPNLQNIPVRTAEGRRVRRAFVPSAPERVLLSADYSQIELRVVAHYSKDPTFLAAYREGLDIHALTASAVFGVAESEVTREMRSAAKEINFGLIYRMGADRLALVTHTPKAEAKAFIERFFQKYATIHALQERFLDQARQQGFAQTLLGRRRYLPEINGGGLAKRMAEGAAVNTPIQGSAAEIIKLAMIRIEQQLRKQRMESRMVLSVHDELVFDVLREEEPELRTLVQKTMESVIGLEVPLVVELGSGANWLDAH
ncbi:MAG TPA: DNA polymerase I [Deltaproteobacteria bacterium]|nr:DNA polymerase I [Deltaproteobacteria bacterium]